LLANRYGRDSASRKVDNSRKVDPSRITAAAAFSGSTATSR
jgi:hypothetical protein